MSQINQLSSIPTASDVNAGDLLVTFSTNNGDSRKLSISNFLEYIRTNLTSSDYITNILTPIDGFNATLTQDSQDRWWALRPANALTSGTIVLPSPVLSADGQQLLITTTKQITNFTVNGNGATELNGMPTVLAAGDFFTIKFNKQTDSWNRIA